MAGTACSRRPPAVSGGKHDKKLVSIVEGLDFGTDTGQFIGKILILFAE